MSAAVCVALVMWFEAGIEPPEGQIATGWAVVNAAATVHKHPWSVCREVRYSGRYMALRGKFGDGYTLAVHPHGARWMALKSVARDILSRKIADPTGGAQFFECTRWRACKNPPGWAGNMELKGRFGSQMFWKLH